MDLRAKHCVPCEGGIPPLGDDEARELLAAVDSWALDGGVIKRRFEFADFAAALVFVNRMAEVAEAEGHHPDFCVHWSRVDVSIWTHAVGGLTENDFILAAKIDAIPR
jgi:4a-hydroxytetrahydrobiopterin dehydratase